MTFHWYLWCCRFRYYKKNSQHPLLKILIHTKKSWKQPWNSVFIVYMASLAKKAKHGT